MSATSIGSLAATQPSVQLDKHRIRAISLDLDDTLWPIWPTIIRAEAVLHRWLGENAPATAALFGPEALRSLREQMVALRPDLLHDLSALRLESIRLALVRAGDEPALAESAFALFLAERHRVELFEGAHDVLAFLSARYPVVAVSNGNADVHRVGIGQYFTASINARGCGVSKPDARIFQAAASAINVPAHNVLHIGDDAVLDVLGAMEAGMQAVWLNSGNCDWPHEKHPHATITSLPGLRHLLG